MTMIFQNDFCITRTTSIIYRYSSFNKHNIELVPKRKGSDAITVLHMYFLRVLLRC